MPPATKTDCCMFLIKRVGIKLTQIRTTIGLLNNLNKKPRIWSHLVHYKQLPNQRQEQTCLWYT